MRLRTLQLSGKLDLSEKLDTAAPAFLSVQLDGLGWPPPPGALRHIGIAYSGGELVMRVDGKQVPTERGEDGVWRMRNAGR